MSFLTRNIAAIPLRTPRPLFASRAFHISRSSQALNENDRGRDNLHEEIEHHKNDGLSKQKEGKGHWKGELASSSEAALKADRGEIDASEETIKHMQKEAEKLAEKTRKS